MNYITKNTAVLAVIFFACTAFIAAQAGAGAGAMTLDDYRRLALANNLDVRTAESALAAGELVRSAAFTRYFPSVSATGALAKPNIFGGGADAGLTADFNNQKLYSVPVADPVIHIDESVNFSDPLSAWAGTVTLTQTLFAGGRIYNSNKLAAKGAAAAAYKLKMKRGEVAGTAESKFYQYALLLSLLETLDLYKATLDNLHAKVEQALAQGVVSRSDFLRVSLKREELTIQRDEVTELLDIALSDLKLFAGIPRETPLTISSGFAAVTEPNFNADEFPARLPLRAEFNLLTIQRDAAKLEAAIAFGGYLPSVEAGISFVRSDFSFNSSLFSDTKGYYQDFLGFVLFNIPLSAWWEGYYKIREKKDALSLAQEQLAVNSEYLLLDMRNKMTAWKSAYKHVKLAEIGLEYAKTNRAEYQQKYDAGISTLSDYLQAMALEHENTTKLNQAKANYFTAKTAFYTAIGQVE